MSPGAFGGKCGVNGFPWSAAKVDNDLGKNLRREDQLVDVDKLVVAVHMAVLAAGELAAEGDAVFQVVGVGAAADGEGLALFTGSGSEYFVRSTTPGSSFACSSES